MSAVKHVLQIALLLEPGKGVHEVGAISYYQIFDVNPFYEYILDFNSLSGHFSIGNYRLVFMEEWTADGAAIPYPVDERHVSKGGSNFLG
ncbi:hypothetical protein TNIN_64501 [Trichonephila inaurata madagascariensis]|uniref:Uncharacterized protein n=1 Tax=Trichonephila inaurata madagascariensis TaxID=2747483 RepID=A0A8X6YG95_9ARAC|nr:hypothetical protein TNIN_64501 [Trichonephila inaurata madagascariensis]